MPRKNYIPVNELLAQTELEDFVTHFGYETPIKRSGNEERIKSPFPCESCRDDGLAISVNWSESVFCSHCYHCTIRGRVTTLLYGMKYGKQPANNPLKGAEFKDIANEIAQVAGYSSASEPDSPVKETVTAPTSDPERKINRPLSKSDDERIRALEYLDQQFVDDPDQWNAQTTSYMKQRPYLTPKVMKQWSAGVLPSASRSMLRGRAVYGLNNERGERIGWAGRDLGFEEKHCKWQRSDRRKSAPGKTKFPPGFVKGSFLYGAEVARLQQKGVREQIQDIGLVVCEGFNDVIALDTHGIVAMGLCSNRAATGQIEKLIRWSRELAYGRITLFLDNDEEGAEGTRQVIEKLADQAHVRTVWRPDSFSGKYQDQQPEHLDPDSLLELFTPISDNGLILEKIKKAT